MHCCAQQQFWDPCLFGEDGCHLGTTWYNHILIMFLPFSSMCGCGLGSVFSGVCRCVHKTMPMSGLRPVFFVHVKQCPVVLKYNIYIIYRWNLTNIFRNKKTLTHNYLVEEVPVRLKKTLPALIIYDLWDKELIKMIKQCVCLSSNHHFFLVQLSLGRRHLHPTGQSCHLGWSFIISE